ncbi:MAG: alpha/beta hydrolase [Planctomycetota bacterium]|jgi:enterochelin esterase family protein
MPDIGLLQCEIDSHRLGNRRTLWLQPPRVPSADTCIFLDGEYYLAHVRAASVVAELQATEVIPSMTAVYVSCMDHDTRWPESFCNDRFAAFLHEELVPWVRTRSGAGENGVTTLAGLSLTGLSAAHAALLYPTTFPRVLCQSGSFWWNDNWLAHNLPDPVAGTLSFRITVGDRETSEDVDHGKGLLQRESQLASNRLFRDALAKAGHQVSYSEFPGGHDVASWRTDLPASLTALSAS